MAYFVHIFSNHSIFATYFEYLYADFAYSCTTAYFKHLFCIFCMLKSM